MLPVARVVVDAVAVAAAVFGLLLTAQHSAYAFMFMLLPRCISGQASSSASAPVSTETLAAAAASACC